MEKIFDKDFLADLFKRAEISERHRQNYDLRNSPADTSQRMLNALMPGTIVPIHRHETTSETVVCFCGRFEEIFYEPLNDDLTEFREIKRYELCPKEGVWGMQIPKGMWHTIEVTEPSVILEAKDGVYKG